MIGRKLIHVRHPVPFVTRRYVDFCRVAGALCRG